MVWQKAKVSVGNEHIQTEALEICRVIGDDALFALNVIGDKKVTPHDTYLILIYET